MIEEWVVRPTLSTPATQAEIERIIGKGWHAEQKIDGERLLVHVHDGKVVPINRSGQTSRSQAGLKEALEAFVWFDGEWCFDGELIGGVYYVFDMPRALQDLFGLPYSDRRGVLENLWKGLNMPENVKLLPSYTDLTECLGLVERVLNNKGEGIIFKKGAAGYQPGKRTRDSLKWKFVKDIDAVVMETGKDGKSNMVVGLCHDETGEMIEIADVTALAGDGARVETGDVVQVRFLYVSNDNRLVQPTLPRIRTDKTPKECLYSQLDEFKTSKEVLS